VVPVLTLIPSLVSFDWFLCREGDRRGLFPSPPTQACNSRHPRHKLVITVQSLAVCVANVHLLLTLFLEGQCHCTEQYYVTWRKSHLTESAFTWCEKEKLHSLFCLHHDNYLTEFYPLKFPTGWCSGDPIWMCSHGRN
jgi:hypothetical protein